MGVLLKIYEEVEVPLPHYGQAIGKFLTGAEHYPLYDIHTYHVAHYNP